MGLDKRAEEAAEACWTDTLGMAEPKRCANNSYENFLHGWTYGVRWRDEHPDRPGSLAEVALLRGKRIAELENINQALAKNNLSLGDRIAEFEAELASNKIGMLPLLDDLQKQVEGLKAEVADFVKLQSTWIKMREIGDGQLIDANKREEMLLAAMRDSIARSDDYGDSHCSQPIREALTEHASAKEQKNER